MYRIDNATAVPSGSGFPTPAPVGPNPNGFWTNGVPGVTSSTIVDADWMNAVQEEILGVITAAGMTPSKTNHNQLQLAISAQGPTGQCRLSVASTTQLKLSPYNGRSIVINGVGYDIPQAGITISNAGLLASTVYFVYLYNNAGTLTLELSTTVHATDATTLNYGVEIKSGDSTRSLVGMIATDASTHFNDTPALRACLNWFNRRGLQVGSTLMSGSTTTSTTPTPLGAAGNLLFLAWADEGFVITFGGYASNTIAGAQNAVSFFVDGLAEQGTGTAASVPASSNVGMIAITSFNETEGAVHLLQVGGQVTSGTGTFTGAVFGYCRG
jgi:hypothetical protein